MKKITFLLAFFLASVMGSYAQCTETSMYPFSAVVSNNSGTAQQITDCNYLGEYAVVNSLITGLDYVFTCTRESVDKYITVTDASNTPIAFGMSPLTVPAIQSATVRLHFSADSGCGNMDECHITTIQAILPCPLPTTVVLQSATTNSASFSWAAGGNESAWQVYIVTSEEPAPTAETEGEPVTVNPTYSDANLDEATSYKFYVRADCSGDFSPWVGPLSFATPCSSTALPIDLETFESTTGTSLPACWSNQIVSGTNNWLGNTPTTGDISTTHSGTRIVYKDYQNSKAYLYSLPLDYTSVTAATRINVWLHRHASTVAGDYYKIYLNTSPSITGAELLTQVFSLTTVAPAVPATGWYNYKLEIPATYHGQAQVFVIFEGYTNNGFSSYALGIDDFTVEAVPTCTEVEALKVVNVTNATATANWTPMGAANSWDYVLGTATDEDPDALSPVNVATSGTAAIADLDPSTAYKVWVRSNCGNGDVSPWTGPVSFTTLCDGVDEFQENFDAAVTFPACWRKVGNQGSAYPQASSASFSLPNNVYIYSGSATTRAVIAMPPVNNASAGTHRLKFQARSAFGTGGVIEVGYLTDAYNADSFVSVSTFATNSITTYQSFVAELGTAPTTGYLAFRHSGVPAQSVYIDDVVWELLPSCGDVSGVTVGNITDVSANLDWNAAANETAWQYVLGSSTDTDPDALSAVDVPTTSQAVIADLDAQTTYKVWVRADCGSGNYGAWVGPFTFATECTAETPAYTQDFSVFPASCWKRSGSGIPATGPMGSDAGIWFEDGFLNNGGTGAIKVNLYNLNRTGWMISPAIDLSGGSFMVTFDYGVTTWGGTSTSPMGSDDTVQLLMTLDNGATWQVVKAFDAASNVSNTLQNYSYAIPAATGNAKFAFYATDGPIDDSPDYDFFIDNFMVDVVPTCIKPTGLAVTGSSITSGSATITWIAPTPAPAEGYEYYFSTTNTAPELDAEASGSVGAGITTANLTDLDPQTTYYVWVRSKCAAADLSVWSASATFKTLCVPSVPDFIQDFTTFVPDCWSTASTGTPATGPTNSAAGIWAADGFLNDGETGAIKVNLYSADRIGWIISPVVDLSAGTSFDIKFDYAVTTWGATTTSPMGSDDSVQLLMTEDGAVWTVLTTFNAASNIGNTVQNFTTTVTSSSPNAKFAFFATDATVNDAPDYDFFIDNFEVTEALSTPGFENNSFAYYPNPVKNELNLTHTKNISDVAVFNILGQQVVAKAINANQSKIDMSHLSAGTYIVKVTSESQIKTFKVVKQ